MKKVTWNLQYNTLPAAIRYCKKCSEKTEFTCSEQFRVNAQRKYLDVWLIYKCPHCDTTWNATVYSRVSPQSLPTDRLDRFHCNDKALAEEYAMDGAFLHKNGAEAGLPGYTVVGDSFAIGENVELEIKSAYSFPIKVSALIRKKLLISQKAYEKLIAEGGLVSASGQDLRKCRLHKGITLRFLEFPEVLINPLQSV